MNIKTLMVLNLLFMVTGVGAAEKQTELKDSEVLEIEPGKYVIFLGLLSLVDSDELVNLGQIAIDQTIPLIDQNLVLPVSQNVTDVLVNDYPSKNKRFNLKKRFYHSRNFRNGKPLQQPAPRSRK